MKRFNLLIIFLFIIFSLTACKDNVTDESKLAQNVVIQPPASNDPDDNISPIDFDGVSSINEVTDTSFKVSWLPVDGAGSYQVFFITDDGLELKKTYDHPVDSGVISGLQPDTSYTIIVRLMDLDGRIDTNQNKLTVTTAQPVSYVNNFSVLFSQSQGISLANSNDMINLSAFTFSLWFKTSSNQSNSDNRLITFHSAIAASTSISAGVDDNKIFIAYKDVNGDINKLETQMIYSDNLWHHLVVTYNSRWITLYLDGKRAKSVKESLGNIGTHPASIGSFSGMSKSFIGLIDEVSIWSSALGLSDIMQIYNNGTSNDLKGNNRALSLNSWYRMGDDKNDSTTLIQDTIGNHNGTPVGIRSSDFVQEAP